MKLFLLERKDHVSWDENISLVVRASSSSEVRRISAKNSSCEGESVWRNPNDVSCKELFSEGSPGVIIINRQAG